MSFRWFIYYSAMCGGCAAFVGWALGRMLRSENEVLGTAVEGLCLGIIVSLILTLLDTLWNGSRAILPLLLRLLVATVVAAAGGFLGALVGQLLLNALNSGIGVAIGWTLTGILVGASVGVFDLFDRLRRKQQTSGARRKIINGIIGGSLGGLLGSLLFLLFASMSKGEHQWMPGAAGFVALGILIGLMVGLAQVILKEAWVKVEHGFRAGREMILSRPEVTIGRAESCDIGLFGDPRVEKLHARILQEGNHYVLEDNSTPDGTYVNDQRVNGRAPLNNGDLIRIGRNILRFSERAKRPAA
jgi:Inner membrane component of T3SS, cytoplasmic domain